MSNRFFARLKLKLIRPIEDAVYRGTVRALSEDAADIRRELQRIALRESASFVRESVPLHLGFQDRMALLQHAVTVASPDGLFLEFGVWKGRTINFMAGIRPQTKFFGFDSFEGLPEPWLYRPKGAFDLESAMPSVVKNVELIAGRFDKTLPPFLARDQSHISFVHIDSDIYSSAAFILDQLTPRLRRDAVIVFDEFMNHPRWRDEERKAFDEWREKVAFDIEFIGYTWQNTAVHQNGQQVAIRLKERQGAL